MGLVAGERFDVELVQSSEHQELLLDARERADVLLDLDDAGSVRWSDDHTRLKRGPEDVHYAALETALLMVTSGFVGAITTDAWIRMKRCAARVLERQSSKAYRLAPR